jgi:hypothetical protein
VLSGDQIPVPARHGLRAGQQPDLPGYVAGWPVRQGGEPGAVRPGGADFLAVQVPFEDGDLVPQRQDLGVFAAVAHR